MGGDEFLVLVIRFSDGGQRSSDILRQMDNVYELLRHIERRLLEADPRAGEVGVGFAIGGAVYDPSRPVDAETLIKQSEEAMYEEKPDDSR
jgi:GGDEF domain-containing protein